MLHMIVATHGPDTCAAADPAVGEMAKSGFTRMQEVAGNHDSQIQGVWTNMPAHTIWFLVDAPNAHVCNQLMQELDVFKWNTVSVQPVITVQEAIGTID